MTLVTDAKAPARIKILVVEDNATDLKLVRSVLTNAGHEVSDARSAEQAVQMLEEQLPQLILTDLKLPAMDGLTMTLRLKQSSKTSSIPVIAMSCYADDYPKKAIKAAGFAAYFIKPINTRTLAQQLAEVLKHN